MKLYYEKKTDLIVASIIKCFDKQLSLPDALWPSSRSPVIIRGRVSGNRFHIVLKTHHLMARIPQRYFYGKISEENHLTIITGFFSLPIHVIVILFLWFLCFIPLYVFFDTNHWRVADMICCFILFLVSATILFFWSAVEYRLEEAKLLEKLSHLCEESDED